MTTIEEDLAHLKTLAADIEQRLSSQPSMATVFGDDYRLQVEVAERILADARTADSPERRNELLASVTAQRGNLARLLLEARVGAVSVCIQGERDRLEAMRA